MNCANHPDRERIAFCQNCGKPLCQECARTVGTAVFCEPCLAARLASTPPGVPGDAASGANYVVDGVVPPPVPGAPSPGLATILGIIPGVGAMYNGQYAKGIIHLVVFAVLIMLASDVNGIFGIFIAGWVVYQIIDANHTARARLAGTPIPNPFGLNDIGEKFGFGKSWPPAAPYAPPAAPYAPPPYVPPAGQTPPYTPPVSNWGAPPEGYNYTAPPASPYVAPFVGNDPNLYNPVPRPNRFPAGALWLIGLGLFFLIGNISIFHHFPARFFTPFLLIGLGVWLFIRKMTDYGDGLTDDGTPMYRLRLVRAMRGSIWIVVVGLMFLFASFNILSWGRSWPIFIIVAGLIAIIERSVFASAAAYNYPPAAPPAPAPPPPPFTSTSIVPVNPQDLHHDDQEGR